MGSRRPPFRAAAVAAALLVAALPLSAHKTQVAGRYRLTIGWGDEPAFTGSRNFVSVMVTDAGGSAITDRDSSLAVEISFGEQRLTVPLRSAADRAGEFRAWLVPTRAGTYTFHITGKIKEQAIDITSTCSDTTFDCVVDAADIQFPARDPSVGQLADRINRSLPRADRAIDTAARAQTTAFVALGTAFIAVAAAFGLGLRRRRQRD